MSLCAREIFTLSLGVWFSQNIFIFSLNDIFSGIAASSLFFSFSASRLVRTSLKEKQNTVKPHFSSKLPSAPPHSPVHFLGSNYSGRLRHCHIPIHFISRIGRRWCLQHRCRLVDEFLNDSSIERESITQLLKNVKP